MKNKNKIKPVDSFIDADGSWFVSFKEKDIKKITKKFKKKKK